MQLGVRDERARLHQRLFQAVRHVVPFFAEVHPDGQQDVRHDLLEHLLPLQRQQAEPALPGRLHFPADEAAKQHVQQLV